MAEPARIAQSASHQGGADAEVAAIRRDRHWAEQQRRLAAGAGHAPQPRGADHAPSVGGDQAQAFGRQAAVAQTLRGLAGAGVAERLVEQRLARFDVGRPFLTQSNHRKVLPNLVRASARKDAVSSVWREGEAGVTRLPSLSDVARSRSDQIW